uniref:Pectinesterase inhibitor domain-containing protein n=1 Tax=Ditylenchus dipsaci TaxID=166011 RepID=A0A915DLM7_9BILA
MTLFYKEVRHLRRKTSCQLDLRKSAKMLSKTLQKHMTLNATFVLVGSIGELRVDQILMGFQETLRETVEAQCKTTTKDGGGKDVGAYTRVTTGCDWIKEITQGEVKCLDMFKEPLIPEPTPSEAA